MEWESNQEEVKEPVDYMKRVIYAIPVCVVLMMIAMALMHEEQHYNSRVEVKHILVAASNSNVEEKAAALEKVIDIKRQLDEGASFKKLAAEYSDDETNRDKGGELGWFERGESVKTFDAYIWVGEVGVVSDPIETIFGYHLIIIMDREISDSEQYQINLNERLIERTNKEYESGQ